MVGSITYEPPNHHDLRFLTQRRFGTARLARAVIERLNHRFRDSAVLQAEFWEDRLLLANDNYQNQIPKPSDFDIFIMILDRRIGSPLADDIVRTDGTPYASGTEYEFEVALESYEISNAPSRWFTAKRARS